MSEPIVDASVPARRRGITVAGRPRFVVVLVIVAAAAAVYDAVSLLRGDAAAGTGWLGIELTGTPAIAATLARMVVHSAGAYGLWMLRAWARLAGMLYLGAILASMLFLWRPPGYGASSAGLAVLWQISMIPLATFCLMYLYRGERDFASRGGAGKNQP